ncbi:MAG: metal ABC transporter substrate-binding protein [Nocardioidaceae bacterium]
MRAKGRAVAAAVAFLPALAVLSSCAGAGASDDGPEPDVIAAFYPYAFVAERVGGSHVDVTDLTRAGIEPHDLELTPQQVADISTADLVIYEKAFQPSVDAAVEQNPPAEALDVTTVVPLQDTVAATEDEDLPGDPHLWQDPTLLVPIVSKVADELAAANPSQASAYHANAAKLIKDLHRLDADFKQGLRHCDRREFVTSHAAFGYLAKRYNLTMIPIAGLSPEAAPSPKHIAALQDIIKAHGITTVFSETLGTRKYADTLAHDLGVTAAVLDPIEGLTDSDSGADYLSLMHGNLAALEEANGCS